jgi:phosphomethylpyrimidine synthase
MNAPDKLAQLLALDARALPRLPAKLTLRRPAHPQIARADARRCRYQRRSASRCTTPRGRTTEPEAQIDVRRGLAGLRTRGSRARADTELYAGRERKALDDGTKHEEREGAAHRAPAREAAALQRNPRPREGRRPT